MDLQKIKTLLDFVGRSRILELTVSDADTTVIIRNPAREAAANLEIPTSEQGEVSTVKPASSDDQPPTELVRASTSGTQVIERHTFLRWARCRCRPELRRRLPKGLAKLSCKMGGVFEPDVQGDFYQWGVGLKHELLRTFEA